ncbi:MAG: acyl-CoA dehydrogenase family protein [Deltaproteobacteria bacterium]|nr:acyl-CoA dehydrogenase family protein [Deltaproteobacteria bacterium]
MKSIYLTEAHSIFRNSVRQFMDKEVAPFADAWERDCRIPKEIWAHMGKLGFLGISFPEEFGGTGADIFYSLIFLEELARSQMGGFAAAVGVQQFVATGAIFNQGTSALKERYLVPSIAGTKVGAICISEPNTGSDVAAIQTTAVREGESWVINGAKTWVTNGVYADFYVIACKTDREAGAGGISLILADAKTSGITSNKLRKMGWHSSDTAELSLENLRVPASNLIGQHGQGFYYIMQTFVMERLTVAASSVGCSFVALEKTLAYMETRQAFGKPINRFQALRHRIADLATELEAARQLVYHAAWLHGQGEQAVKESSMAKLLTTELSNRVMAECLQFYGGFGYVEEYPMARFYRDARVSTIVAGTSEIMREIIAKVVIDKMEFPKIPSALESESATVAEPVTGTETESEIVASSLADLMRSLAKRHRPERTEGWKGLFHFKFKDSANPMWTVLIDSNRCQVSEGLSGTPDCIVTTSEAVYLAIEQGRQNAEMAVLTRKLKISNMGAMMKFSKAFKRVTT